MKTKVKRTENGTSVVLEIEGENSREIAEKAADGRELELVGLTPRSRVYTEHVVKEVMEDCFVEAMLEGSRIGTLLRIEVFDPR